MLELNSAKVDGWQKGSSPGFRVGTLWTQ